MDSATCALWGSEWEGVSFLYFFYLFIHLLFLLFTNFGPAEKPEHSYLDSYNSS